MAFGGFDQNNNSAPMSEINTTPLVDVMLVLLIIFIITAPLLTHAVPIDLPKASSQPLPEKPETITLSLKANGEVWWNNDKISEDALPSHLSDAAHKSATPPDMQLRADKDTRYEKIAQVMSTARNNGIQKIGFVTDPSGK